MMTFFGDIGINIVTPTAGYVRESVPFPSIDDWNKILHVCLQSNASWEAHHKLHHFLIDWNKCLHSGWLRLLLSQGHCNKKLVDSKFYGRQFNAAEKILVLLLSIILQAHKDEDSMKHEVHHRVQTMEHAFHRSKNTLSTIFRTPPVPEIETQLDNIRVLLMQSLCWRRKYPDEMNYTKDPLFIYICSGHIKHPEDSPIKTIEQAVVKDTEISTWLSKNNVAPLIRYLISTKHPSQIRFNILNQFAISTDVDHFVPVQQPSTFFGRMCNALEHSFHELTVNESRHQPEKSLTDLAETRIVNTETVHCAQDDFSPSDQIGTNVDKSLTTESLNQNDRHFIVMVSPSNPHENSSLSNKSCSGDDNTDDERGNHLSRIEVGSLLFDQSCTSYKNAEDEESTNNSSREESKSINQFRLGDKQTKPSQSKRGGDTIQRFFGDKETILDTIQTLTAALCCKNGWRNAVVLANEPEYLALISPDQSVMMHKKLTLLRHAACIALENPEKNLREISEETSKHFCFEKMSAKSIHRTFTQFKKNKFKQLPHPCSREVDSMAKTMRIKNDHFLLTNEDLKMKFISHAREVLRAFSVDRMHQFANTAIMPEIKSEIRGAIREKNEEFQSEAEEEKRVNEIIKRQYGFRNGVVSRTTVYTWIRMLDFNYNIRKKQYFVDRHEDQKDQRIKYIQVRFQEEIYQPVWVQVSASKFKSLQDNGTLQPAVIGFPYQDNDGSDMVEFHVDDDKGDTILKMVENTLYGGFFSVRRQVDDPKVILFGHDEAIMKQNQFSPRAWVMGDGTAILTPKTEGAGVMYSLFVSRTTGAGFGTFWNENVKEIVNRNRVGQKYFDEEAAVAVHGRSEKGPLNADPANLKFVYGGANGWWDGDRVVNQVEDFLDVFKVAFPHHHPILLFDHSTGHSKGRKNGLNVNNMNKNFEGKQQYIHPSIITANCLGPFSPKLRVGDEQKFTFEEGDEGPFYLGIRERVEKKYDSHGGRIRKPKPLTNMELTEKLNSIGITFIGKKKKAELVDLAKSHGITLTHPPENLQEGWLKKQGMFQVAWERGLLDPEKILEYKVDPPCDQFGIKDKTLSLREILSSCEDFQNEESQLQFVIRSLGGSCRMSPKYHPEIAGEGIENLWGYIKKLYRIDWGIREMKDQKEADFISLISRIMDGSDGRINTTVVRKSARRARDYMLAYSLIQKRQEHQERQQNGEEELHHLSTDEYGTDWGADKISVTYALIEKVFKQIRSKKTHRAPRDLDTAFINSL